MPRNDADIRNNFNKKYVRTDNNMNPYDGGMKPSDVKKNWNNGPNDYHKAVGNYAAKNGWSYRSNASNSED